MKQRITIKQQSPSITIKVSKNIKEELEGKVQSLSKEIEHEVGIVVSSIQIELLASLKESSYQIFMKNKVIRQGDYKKDRYEKIKEIIKMNCYRIVEREDINEAFDSIVKEYPHLKKEYSQGYIKLGVIHKIFVKLVKEGVSVSYFKEILEAIFYHHDYHESIDSLVFAVRCELRDEVIKPYLKNNGVVDVINFDASSEEKLEFYEMDGEYHLRITKTKEKELIDQFKQIEKITNMMRAKPVLVVQKFWTRVMIANMLHRHNIFFAVFTKHELFETNEEFKGKKRYGEIGFEKHDSKEKREQGEFAKRKKLIDKALEKKDKEMFLKLTSQEWKKYL